MNKKTTGYFGQQKKTNYEPKMTKEDEEFVTAVLTGLTRSSTLFL
jgi:hypothetical protein